MNKNLIESIDHFVLTTKKINDCKNFYCNFLGMELNEFTDDNETRYSFKFGHQKINIHFFEKPYSKTDSWGAPSQKFSSSYRF